MAPDKVALHLLLASFLSTLLVQSANAVPIALSDRASLTNVINGFGPSAKLLKNWDFKYDCSKWEGVTCDSKGKVTQIKLNGKKFAALSASIGGLTALTYLILNDCGLKGQIPSTIGKLTKLEYLDLGKNSFTGTIPDALYSCTLLTSLALNNNTLYGPLSPKINMLADLYYLDISYNLLSGAIPSISAYIFQVVASGNYFYKGDPKDSVYTQTKRNSFYYNCLINPPAEFMGTTGQAQRPAAQCTKFCNAGSSKGPCGGNGYCYFDKSIPKCLCNTGYKPSSITCIKG